jgi:hypothetical protein
MDRRKSIKALTYRHRFRGFVEACKNSDKKAIANSADATCTMAGWKKKTTT